MQKPIQTPPVKEELSHRQVTAAATGQASRQAEGADNNSQSVSRRLSRAAVAAVAEVADTAQNVRDAVELLLGHCLCNISE